jgi:hypothetical protein
VRGKHIEDDESLETSSKATCCAVSSCNWFSSRSTGSKAVVGSNSRSLGCLKVRYLKLGFVQSLLPFQGHFPA